MQRLHGDGLAFVHAGGTLEEKTLAPGETLRVDTGCLVAFQPSVTYDIQMVGGIKTTLFGGEGLFFATLHRPGPRVAAVAAVLAPRRPHLRRRPADRRRGGAKRARSSAASGNLLDGDGR